MNRTFFEPTVVMTYPLAQGLGGDPERSSDVRPAADHTVYWPSGSGFTWKKVQMSK